MSSFRRVALVVLLSTLFPGPLQTADGTDVLYLSRSNSTASSYGTNHSYQVERWDMTNGQSLGLLNLPASEYRDLTFGGPSSDLIVDQLSVSPTNFAGSMIGQYDRNTGSLIRTFGADAPILGMAISPEGALYVSRSNSTASTYGTNHSYQVERWDMTNGQSLGLLNLPASEYRDLTFGGPSSDVFVNQLWVSPTSHAGSMIGQYDRITGSLIRMFGADAPILGMAISPEGALYVSRSDSTTSTYGTNHSYQVERWDMTNGQSLGLLNLPASEYRDLTFGGPSSDLIVDQLWVSPTSHAGSMIGQYDRITGSLIRTFGADAPILGLAVPEPASLFGTGIVMCGALVLRRRRTNR